MMAQVIHADGRQFGVFYGSVRCSDPSMRLIVSNYNDHVRLLSPSF
jgi:hypothetical protein